MKPTVERRAGMDERAARFKKLVLELEEHLDSGFFLSLMGKVVVDERKIYSLLSELRTIDFDAEPAASPVSAPAQPAVELPEHPDQALEDALAGADAVRKEAEEFADSILARLEKSLLDTLEEVRNKRQDIAGRRTGRQLE